MRHRGLRLAAAPALCLLAALGIPVFIRALRDLLLGLRRRRAESTPAPSAPPEAARAVRLAAVAVALAVSGHSFLDWIATRGAHVADDGRRVEAALRVRDATAHDATIAVVWAGTLPYFAERRAVDLLGKNDRAIARLPARDPWWPGHSKWDTPRSLGRGDARPDVVLELWRWSAADFAYLRSLGYERPGGGPWVRRDSRRVDRARLASGLWGLQRGGFLY